MILSRQKPLTKTLKNGIWDVVIRSVHETSQDGKNVVVFNLSGEIGATNLTLPVNNKLHGILCNIMHHAGISEWTGLGCLVNRRIKIHVINNKIKYILS